MGRPRRSSVIGSFAHRVEPVPDDAETTLRVDIFEARDLRPPFCSVGQRYPCAVRIRIGIGMAQGDIPVPDYLLLPRRAAAAGRSATRLYIFSAHGGRNQEPIAENRTLRQGNGARRVHLRIRLPVVVLFVEVAVAVVVERKSGIGRVSRKPPVQCDLIHRESILSGRSGERGIEIAPFIHAVDHIVFEKIERIILSAESTENDGSVASGRYQTQLRYFVASDFGRNAGEIPEGTRHLSA